MRVFIVVALLLAGCSAPTPPNDTASPDEEPKIDVPQQATLYFRSGTLDLQGLVPYTTVHAGGFTLIGYVVADIPVPETVQNLSITWSWDATSNAAGLDELAVSFDSATAPRVMQGGVAGEYELKIENPAQQYEIWLRPTKDGAFSEITLNMEIVGHWIGQAPPR